jgi:hypothetical protein
MDQPKAEETVQEASEESFPASDPPAWTQKTEDTPEPRQAMLRSLKAIRGYSIQTLDGTKGTAHDFYLDDLSWIIRYLVVDTGEWLPGRRVLISPLALRQPDWASQVFPVALTREQIEKSPDVDTEKPVSRQMELALARHYRWPIYWTGTAAGDIAGGFAGPAPEMAMAAEMEKDAAPVQNRAEDPHLRNMQDVVGYRIEATDGRIGHLDDFIVDDDKWVVRYLVIDTKNWLPGRKVLINPQWALDFRWAERAVHVRLTQEAIRHSPPFDPAAPINRDYESKLYDYYGRPRDW